MAKLNIEGIWKGVLDVDLEIWTISMLREQIAKKSNGNSSSINLMYLGKILNDGDGQQKLTQLGIKNNANILVTSSCAEKGKAINEKITHEEIAPIYAGFGRFIREMTDEERLHKFNRIKKAATALAEKHGDNLVTLNDDDLNMEIFEKNGENLTINQRALILGLRLDINGKRLMTQQNFEDAKKILRLGDEAFLLCDDSTTELLDNIPVLQVNIVWCSFMVRDIDSFAREAEMLLKRAWAGLQRIFKTNARFPVDYTGGLAFLMRLRLLEGVVTYYNDPLDRARRSLISAKRIFEQRDSKGSLLSLMNMRLSGHEILRALQMCNKNLRYFLELLLEQKKENDEERERQRERRRKAMLEQAHYGKTLLNKPIDLQKLQQLVSFGFEQELAVEALRETENNIHSSVEALINPAVASNLQVNVQLRKRKREEEPHHAEIETFVEMGFERSKVIAAFKVASNAEEVAGILLPEPNKPAEENPRPSSKVRETDALSGYGTDITIEGKAIDEYWSLVQKKIAKGKGKQKAYDD